MSYVSAKKSSGVFCLVFLMVFSAFARQEKPSRPFIIVSESIPPFEYMNNGEADGINIQLVKMVMSSLELDYEIRIASDVRALELARQGKADALLSVSWKPERTEFLNYPEGFDGSGSPKNFMWASEYSFFAPKGRASLMNIDGYADAASKGLKVGYIEGVSYAPAFWDAGLKLVPGTDDESNFKKLLDGDIDIYIAEKNIARAAIKKLGIKDKVAVIPKTLI